MNLLEKFRDIHTFVFDVDGVLTNGEIIIMEDGKLIRKMNIRDGYAMKRAIQQGYRVAIITGGKSSGVVSRLEGLGITDIYKSVENKLDVFESFIITYDLDSSGILYMGDDLPDYEPMRKAGLSCCPQDAANEIIEVSRYISPLKGGQGCVREVIEKVLKLHGKWLDETQQTQTKDNFHQN